MSRCSTAAHPGGLFWDMPAQLASHPTSRRGSPGSMQSGPWPGTALAIALSALSAACGPSRAPAPLPPAALSAGQTSALQHMNTAGRTAFDGRTWTYEFGANCTLRIRRSYEGNPDGQRDVSMAGRKIEVVAYLEGFGVKAYARGMGGSEDLFDAASADQAQEFSRAAGQLIGPCGGPVRAGG